ncbi:MAG: methyl-accepting chemotaxis protein [Desulfobulbaceae bacterium]|nr:methyl-accepting chemotaxis protein [Desulfobulbaceae bacterium]HIJ78041.1 methyl-accepting chemotaxis protein [Deltaproteobacteria bacterium]
MKLTLRAKVMGIPLFLVFLAINILLGSAIWVVTDMWRTKVAEVTASQQELAEKSFTSLKTQALTIAAMAAKVPGVQEAYKLAASGDENAGRKILRDSFDAIHQEVCATLDIKSFKIHFHLPPAKSFLRIWRESGKKDGGDDISSFRETVLQVSRNKTKLAGIEIGRGGFAVRGLVPITGDNGQYLGSVEALLDLNKLFETAKALDSDNVAVYMSASELEIARNIRDKKPPITGEMARIFSSSQNETDPYITAELLQKAVNQVATAETNGRLLTAIPIRDYANTTKGVLVFVRDASEQIKTINMMRWGLFLGGGVLLVLMGASLYIFTGNITKRLNNTIETLEVSGGKMVQASNEISSASHLLAEGSTEQAASLQETAASLEEMSSMTRTNAENAKQADVLMGDAQKTITTAEQSMGNLNNSMTEIAQASEETSKIIKTIDEIAFQTNLLALNAAVEAARAGEAGAGFAVVADEVRNLAMRAAEAAKNTSELIEGTVEKVKTGSSIASKTNEAFNKVSASATKISGLVSEIAEASNEQAHGIDQVNKAISQIDSVTQQNAANAEESASAAEELNAQANQLQHIVVDLAALVTGSDDGVNLQKPTNKPLSTLKRPTPPAPVKKITKKQLPAKISEKDNEIDFEDF